MMDVSSQMSVYIWALGVETILLLSVDCGPLSSQNPGHTLSLPQSASFLLLPRANETL